MSKAKTDPLARRERDARRELETELADAWTPRGTVPDDTFEEHEGQRNEQARIADQAAARLQRRQSDEP